MKKCITITIEILLVILIVYFIGMYFYQSREYKKGAEEYTELSSYVRPSSAHSVNKNNKSDEAEENKSPKLEIDFDGLLKQNPDFLGWIYLPGLNISYPIVQGTDDEYYLHHTYTGETNSSGCIFMEAQSTGQLKSYNTFLYGHNMKNGTMFGGLKRYIRENDFLEANPDFYIYTRDASYKYSIYSYYITSPVSDTYQLTSGREEYSKYQKHVLSLSSHDCNVDVDPNRPTVTLSTCSGSGENKQRLVVHGIQCEKLVNKATSK